MITVSEASAVQSALRGCNFQQTGNCSFASGMFFNIVEDVCMWRCFT